MKRFTKIMLIIAVVCFVLGTGIIMAATAMGGSPSGIRKQLRNQNHHSRKVTVESMESVPVESGDSGELEIAVQAGAIRIIQEAGLETVEVRNLSRHAKLERKRDGDSIELEFSKKRGIHHLFAPNDVAAVVVIPENHGFRSISLDIDAGAVLADDLTADTLELDMGAGAAELQNILADTVLVECSAGAVDFQGEIQKRLDVEVDAGAVEMKLFGVPEDYNYHVDVTAGGVEVDGREFNALSRDQRLQNEGAEKEICLECNAGKIEITFEK